MQRLEWFNQKRLQHEDRGRVAELVRGRLVETYGRYEAADGTAHEPETWFQLLVGAAQEEATTLSDIVVLCGFALQPDRPDVSPEAADALSNPWSRRVLVCFLEALGPTVIETPENANAWLTELRHALRDSDGLRGQQVMFPIRAALTGSLRGPCLGIITSLLGEQRCRVRARDALMACPTE